MIVVYLLGVYSLSAVVLMAASYLLTEPKGTNAETPLELFFLWFFSRFGTPARDIQKFKNGVNDLYLRRFYVTPKRLARFLERLTWWKWPTKIFLHHILRSDDDRDCHDHPWRFTSLILLGSYKEQILNHWELVDINNRPTWRPEYRERLATPGSLLRNKAEHTHKVEIIRPVWSLVFACPARRVWGFWTQQDDAAKTPKWVPWRKYLGIPEERERDEDVIVAPASIPIPDHLASVTRISFGPLTVEENGRRNREKIDRERITDASEEVTKPEDPRGLDVTRRETVSELNARVEELIRTSRERTGVTVEWGNRNTGADADAMAIAAGIERKGE